MIERKIGNSTDEQMQRIIGGFSAERTNVYLTNQAVIEMLRKNALKEYDKNEPLPFSIMSYSVNEDLSTFFENPYALTLDKVVPLIDFIHDFSDVVARMGINIPLISEHENDEFLQEDEMAMTGFIGETKDESDPHSWGINQTMYPRLQHLTEDRIVEYLNPGVFSNTGDRVHEFYRLERHRKQIIVAPTDKLIGEFTPEQLLQTYIVHSLDRQNAASHMHRQLPLIQ